MHDKNIDLSNAGETLDGDTGELQKTGLLHKEQCRTLLTAVYKPTSSHVLTRQFMRCLCTATQFSICSYRGHTRNCCRHEICTALPQNEHSPWKLRSRDIGEKAKQNSARNNAKCSKRFQFLCKQSDRTWYFNELTLAMSLWRCWKPRPPASVFNTSLGTCRMLMYEKPCLIPIMQTDKIPSKCNFKCYQ